MKKLYSYAELRGKIKVGDMLRNKYEDVSHKVTVIKEDYFCLEQLGGYGFNDNTPMWYLDESPRQPTWDDLRVGDVLIDRFNITENPIYEITGKIFWFCMKKGGKGLLAWSIEELKEQMEIKQLEDPEKAIEIDGKKLTLTQLKEAVKKLEE